MDKISIIIPVYNVEKYIQECLNSVLNQTYENLEIILVDDGSKDSSSEICESYAKKDDRIIVIHQENQGLSMARNTGLNRATGKYIMFLDSDDFYEINSCEVLYNEIRSKNADFVIGNYVHTKSNGEKWKEPFFDKDVYTRFKVSILDYKKSFSIMNSIVWNKIFRRDFIEKYSLRFIPGAIAEDAIFSTFCYTHTDNAYYINDVVYNYRQNDVNSTISTNCSKIYFSRINAAYKTIYKNFYDTNTLGFYRYFYARTVTYILCKIIDTNLLKNDKEIIEVLEMLDWFFNQKTQYNVVIVNEKLNNIIDSIIKKQYKEVLKKIKIIKEYRKNISDIEAQKMYVPNEKTYIEMSKYDYKYDIK